MNGVFTSSSSQPNGSVILDQTEQQVIQDLLGLNNSYSSLGLSFLLPAGAKFLLNVAFKPLSKDMASTLILLRNNLTGIETIWLKGRAGTGQMTVGNGTPGSSLLFQLTEKILQGCQSMSVFKQIRLYEIKKDIPSWFFKYIFQLNKLASMSHHSSPFEGLLWLVTLEKFP
jgi:hypothetical protein